MHISKISKYSYKAIIQFAYNKMKQQGFQQSSDEGDCKYLGPNSLRCGASWFLMEEEAAKGDGNNYKDIRNVARSLGYKLPKKKMRLLEAIQSAHDAESYQFFIGLGCVRANEATMKSRFLKLAEVYGVELKE